MNNVVRTVAWSVGFSLMFAGVIALAQNQTAGPGLEKIRSWRLADELTLTVDTFDMRTYRLKLNESCEGLEAAERIGFSAELASVSGAPSSVLLDSGRECQIASIARVEWKPRQGAMERALANAEPRSAEDNSS